MPNGNEKSQWQENKEEICSDLSERVSEEINLERGIVTGDKP
jgi:hypothetical protein